MNMRRKGLMNSTAMRHQGFMSIGEEDGTGGTDSGGGSNNQGGGNQGTGGNTAGTQDNAGQAFDPAKFWEEPAPPKTESPSGGSAGSGGGGGQQQQQVVDPAKDFSDRLAGVKFSPAFNDATIKELGEGKVDGINTVIGQQLQQSLQQSVMYSAELIKRSQEHILGKIQEMMDGKLGSRDNTSALSDAFPTYKDPGMKPVIDGIFGQAMKVAGNDRGKALEFTKSMMRYMGSQGGADLGITTPPEDPHGVTQGSKSLLDDLLGRS